MMERFTRRRRRRRMHGLLAPYTMVSPEVLRAAGGKQDGQRELADERMVRQILYGRPPFATVIFDSRWSEAQRRQEGAARVAGRRVRVR